MAKFFSLIILFFISLTLQAQNAGEILDRFSQTLAVPTIQGTFHVQLIAKNGDTREIQARVVPGNSG